MFYCCFFLFSVQDLWAPSANRPETLPRDWKYVLFYNPVPKFGGFTEKKFGGQKRAKFGAIFEQLHTSIGNISKRDQDIHNRKNNVSTAIPPAFGEKSPVNFGPLTTKLEMWTRTHPNQLFWKTIFRPSGGAAPEIFTRAREWPRLDRARL